MPCAYFDAKVIGRSTGSSAVASAAYRSGETLYDDRAGKRFDYQHRDGVMHSEISTPDGAPAWTLDRSRLWNMVEQTEKRKDAQLARDIIAALPRELDLDQQKDFVRDFIGANFTSRGMVADWSIHESDAGDGGKNPHVHIMLTMRHLDGEGFGNKAREWNSPNLVTEWRSSWETIQNRHLEMAGSVERISMRSYEDQGINKEPQYHLGPDAHNLEAQGFETRVGDWNRAVTHRNDVQEVIAERLEFAHFEPGDFDYWLPGQELDNERQSEATASGFGWPAEADSSPAAAVVNRDELEPFGDWAGRPEPTPAPGSAQEEHQATLAEYFRVTWEQTVEAAAEMVNRLGDWFERTAELGRESFEQLIQDERSGFEGERQREWGR